ncbi:MAG: zf-HC2 domain-containing protein [Gemmatimonadota bacterium]
MRPHVPDEELHAYADGELSPAQRAEIAEHLLACLICRALYGEVGELRSRTAALLAIAVPRATRRPAARSRRPLIGVAAAAAVLIGFTTWLSTPTAPAAPANPRLATAFVAPTLFARIGNLEASPAEAVSATTDQRTMTLASRAAIRPKVVGSATMTPAVRRMRPIEPLAVLDPSAGWESMSWDEAKALNGGALAQIDGEAVVTVRIKRSQSGGRPTFMVRHLLADGRSLWVVEGPTDEVGEVYRLLEASGMSIAMPLRATPDYVGAADAPVRTVRMVTVAGYLPVTDLNEMESTRLTLK